MAVLKPYLEYRDSGVPWLGEVPKHWKVQKLRTIMKGVTERNRPDLPLLSVVREKGVVLRDITEKGENRNFIPDDLSNYKVVREGQFVMNKMKAWQGSYGVSRYNGIVSPAYFVFDIHLVEGSYFHSAIRSKAYVPLFTQASDGVRIGQWDLSQVRMKEIPFFIPSLAEQSAIVRFLDHMDRRIRCNILAKQKLIKLLEEYKQVIIHSAVTRGLDPTVPLKPSGVEWLDDVPEHWEVLALKRVLRSLIDCEHKTAPKVDSSEYLVVRTSAIRKGRLCLEGTYYTATSTYKEWTRRGLPEPGDVIFTREAPAGEACVVPMNLNLCLGQRTVLMKVRHDVYDPLFLVHMIYAGPPHDHIMLASQGSTVGHFNMDDIGCMQILKPPIEEQKEIVKWIADGTRVQDLAITQYEKEIVLLSEYRTRLISDVVTGKIDVRGINLPAEEDAGVPAEGNDLFDTKATQEDCEIPEDEIPAEAD